MTQAERVRRAKQGDPEAIAQLLHLALYRHGIRVKAHSAPGCLQILLEAHRFPERHQMVAFIHRGLAQLQIDGVRMVELYARRPGGTHFIWCDGFDVKAPVLDAPEPTPASFSDSGGARPDASHAEPDERQDGAIAHHASTDALAELESAEIVARIRSGAIKFPNTRHSSIRHPHRQADLGWRLVHWLRGMNPFAAGLMTILALHSLLGSRHYTPEGFMAARDPMMMVLHHVNLIIHEAGHPLFGILGEFMGLLGGSLLQVLVPAVLTGYFFLTKQRFAGAIALWWIGQNLLDVSFYIKDAQERMIPLLGGEAVLHDWHFLLLKMNLLPLDDAIAGVVYSLGILVYGVAIALGFYFAYTPPKSDR